MANVGNHLHLHVQLTNRFTYNPFIRAVTGAIAIAVMGSVRRKKFWDRRPFSRIVQSFTAYLRLRSYVRINELESFGISREEARDIVRGEQMLSG